MASKIKIAILGSNGTIGRILMEELSHHEPIGVTRQICDLRDRSALDTLLTELKPDAVVLCATVGGKQSFGNFDQTDLYNNLKIFQNLESLSTRYKVLINLGSGAEFDVKQNISNAHENLIYERLPEDSYGLAKNIISRACRNILNATTLRIFGCFDSREPDFRLLKSFTNSIKNKEYNLSRDRHFSWISGKDLAKMVELVAEYHDTLPKDINCVYNETPLLSETLALWCKLHNIKPTFNVVSNNEFDYTGNSDRMRLFVSDLNILTGYEQSLKEYKL